MDSEAIVRFFALRLDSTHGFAVNTERAVHRSDRRLTLPHCYLVAGTEVNPVLVS